MRGGRVEGGQQRTSSATLAVEKPGVFARSTESSEQLLSVTLPLGCDAWLSHDELVRWMDGLVAQWWVVHCSTSILLFQLERDDRK